MVSRVRIAFVLLGTVLSTCFTWLLVNCKPPANGLKVARLAKLQNELALTMPVVAGLENASRAMIGLEKEHRASIAAATPAIEERGTTGCIPRQQKDIWPVSRTKPPPQLAAAGAVRASAASSAASILPLPISFNRWRRRRTFHRAHAEAELCFPTNRGTDPRGSGGLTEDDRKVLARIYFQSESVFEVGVGESTLMAAFTGVPRLTGVDGSLGWLDRVRASMPAHYRMHWADIGPTRKWSYPTDAATTPKWPFYSTAALAAEGAGFDFYLVDGRFRVATFAACFLHAERWGLRRHQFMVGLHDFKKRHNNGYQAAMSIADIVDGHDPSKNYNDGAIISIFRRKPGVSSQQIRAVWEAHRLKKN